MKRFLSFILAAILLLSAIPVNMAYASESEVLPQGFIHSTIYHRNKSSEYIDVTRKVLNSTEYRSLKEKLPNGEKTDVTFYALPPNSSNLLAKIPAPEECTNWKSISFSYENENGSIITMPAYYCAGCVHDCNCVQTFKTTVENSPNPILLNYCPGVDYEITLSICPGYPIITERDASNQKSLLTVLKENNAFFTLLIYDSFHRIREENKIECNSSLLTYSAYSSVKAGPQLITVEYNNKVTDTFTIFNTEFVTNLFDESATSKNGIYYNSDGNFVHGFIFGENESDFNKRFVLKPDITMSVPSRLASNSILSFYKNKTNEVGRIGLVIFGDVDANGKINSADASQLEFIIKQNHSKEDFALYYFYACDVNRDNIIDNKDLAKVKEAAALYEKLEGLEKGSAEYKKTLQEYQDCIPQGKLPNDNSNNNNSKPSLWERFMAFIRQVFAFFGIKI